MADIEDLDIAIYRDAAELTEVTVDEALEEIRIGLEERGIFHLALTGGTIGVAISKEIAKYVSTGEWPGLHIWWSDAVANNFGAGVIYDLIGIALVGIGSAFYITCRFDIR